MSILKPRLGFDPKRIASSRSLGILTKSLDPQHEIDFVLKNTGKRLNESYQRVRKRRAKIPRRSVSIKLYNRFLRQLYGTSVGGDYETTAQQLYEAYQGLPFPPPLHIQAEHLEDLLTLLMSGKWETQTGKSRNTSQAGRIFLNVLADVEASEMPIAAREYNSAMVMTSKSDRRAGSTGANDTLMPLVRDRYTQLKATHGINDVSSLNMLLAIGSKTDEKDRQMQHVLQEFAELDLKPDRSTMMIYMRDRGRQCDIDGVKGIFQEMQTSGFTIDIKVMNIVMYSFIVAGDLRSAEAILQTLVEHELKLAPCSDKLTKSRLERKLQMMDFLKQIVREHGVDTSVYQIPTVPDYFTFKTFFNHYCMFGDFEKAIETLQTMKLHDCEPTRHQFFQLIQTFLAYSRKNHSEWSLERLKYVLGMMGEQHYTYELAENVLKVYERLVPDADLRVLWDDIQSRKQPMKYVVYNTLQALIIN